MMIKKVLTQWMMRLILPGAAVFALCGCSRETINYQIAESIGTLGVYENGEPVETPRMREQRELQEALDEQESVFGAQLDEVMRLADSYYFDEALEKLDTIEKNELTTARIEETAADIQSRISSVKTYEGNIPHLCFPTLIEDTLRAFDGDTMASTYYGNMITVSEFEGILEQLHENGYVLIDIHDIACDETDNRGITTMEYQKIRLPAGKKPIVLSQDNVNYSGIKNGDGIATKLVLDEGKVKALYTDAQGHDLKGDYDFVPVLERFVEEHPDFSYRGAKGIVSVSASEGIFGYAVEESPVVTDVSSGQEAVRNIAKALTDNGWYIACAGYDHGALNELSSDGLRENIGKWKETAGAITGDTDILFYPYGYEVQYPSEQLNVLIDEDFAYLCGLWGDKDYLDKGDDYLRQTRRFVDGYTLNNASGNFSNFFDARAVLDDNR